MEQKLNFQVGKLGSGKGILGIRCIRNHKIILAITEQSNLSQGNTGTGTWEQVSLHLESRASRSENVNK